MKRTIALMLVLLPARGVAAQAAQGTQEPPKFPAGVEQVIVDTVVTDKKGKPITGLDKAAFQVLEDGAPQDIVSFEAVVAPPAPAAKPAAPPVVSTNTSAADRSGRTFVIVFDDVHMSPVQSLRAKGAVAEFLKNGVREGDHVTLVATGGGAWWSARMEAGRDELMTLLKRLEGRKIPDISPERMSDYEAMRIHVYNDNQMLDLVRRRFENLGVVQRDAQGQDTQRSDYLGDPTVRSRAQEVYFQSVSRNRITLQVLKRILDSLRDAKGRKSVILVSEGFIDDPNLDEFKQVVQSSRRSNAAIYFLDTRGLGGIADLYSAEFQSIGTDPRDLGQSLLDNVQAADGSSGIASDTGGFTVTNTNDLGAGIERIANETLSYYLIGYNPTNTKQDGRFRKIEVKIARKDLKVRARKGYYAPLEGKAAPAPKPGETDPVIQAAIDSPYEDDGVPLRMTSYVFDETLLGKLSALVVTDVDVRDFGFQEQDGRLVDALEFLLVVAHKESGEYYQYNQKVEMKLLPATRERIARTWYPIVRDFELAPGGYQAKIVVRDKNTGRVGTVIHDFQVPDPTSFRTSSIALTDTLQAGEAKEGPPRPLYLARRSFPSGAMLYVQYSVFGAAKDAKSGMPKVDAGFVIRGKDGKAMNAASATTIQPTSLGRLSRFIGTPLQDYPPGDYEFVLSLKDEISGKALEQVEPFTVVAADAGTAPAATPGASPGTPGSGSPSTP